MHIGSIRLGPNQNVRARHRRRLFSAEPAHTTQLTKSTTAILLRCREKLPSDSLNFQIQRISNRVLNIESRKDGRLQKTLREIRAGRNDLLVPAIASTVLAASNRQTIRHGDGIGVCR